MRVLFSVIFTVLAIALLICAVFAYRSHKAIGRSVCQLVLSLIPPLVGNLLIVSSGNHLISTVGCYIYFIGMDLVMFSLLLFTLSYCSLSWKNNNTRVFVFSILGIDVVQLLLNPIFHHAFATEAIELEGYAYYRLIPYAGQTFHRVVDYSIFISVVIIFIIKTVRSSRINSERYSVILMTMLVVGLIQTFYIFSRSPIDRSMIGYGIFGLMVCYFSILYRPMRLLDQMLANIASQMNEALFFFDGAGRCIWANKPGMELVHVDETSFDPAVSRLKELFGNYEEAGECWCSKQQSSKDNSQKYYQLEYHIVTDDRGIKSGSFLSIRDNTAEQQALEAEKYSARHDALTGLYTREYLYSRIRETLQNNPDTVYCIIFIDIREFKIINDIFGTNFGDFTIKAVGDWLRTSLPSESIYGRLAGDTYGACVRKEDFDKDRIENELTDFTVSDGNITHPILIHLGVYEVLDPETEISVMFDRAHMAISAINNQYQTHVSFYSDEMRERVLWNQHISAQLHNAIERREIQPYLQPIVDKNGVIVGAEALVRWIHPTEGFLSPAMFVPVFENNGMISEVDKYMWRCACEILSRWKQEGNDRFISINISPKDFYFMNVLDEVIGLVEEFKIEPSKLRIEITETVMMTDVVGRMEMLRKLKDYGFIVEIDDFGSGYSSLNMLKDMPVDLLKIDMAFLNKSNNTVKAEKIIHNIINMSHDLGISPLTEGVETESQYRMLTDMGCGLFQGYYFAKPMSVADYEAFCRKQSVYQ